jgi:hypothetical protein
VGLQGDRKRDTPALGELSGKTLPVLDWGHDEMSCQAQKEFTLGEVSIHGSNSEVVVLAGSLSFGTLCPREAKAELPLQFICSRATTFGSNIHPLAASLTTYNGRQPGGDDKMHCDKPRDDSLLEGKRWVTA